MKPHVFGLWDKVRKRWFYVAACHQCDWAYGFNQDISWSMAMTMAEAHAWIQNVAHPIGAAR
ncbi:hypothetical protein ACH4A8_41095 [Streptomyces vietnamensis]|uniref:hypothetical protein n=1 Tax=Streptomyces vietnamensis TaxID=362257 RepID=UPI0037983CAF